MSGGNGAGDEWNPEHLVRKGHDHPHPAVRTGAVTATACDPAPPDSPPSQTQTRDSAGILIVENPSPAPGSRLEWQVSLEPTVSIGTIAGGDDFQLHHVGDALRLPDGRIVVANAGSHQLLVFDEAGSYLEAWGRRGEGPGDFRNLRGSDGLSPSAFWIEPWPGDSLAVCSGIGQDLTNVVSVWDTRGRHGRTLNLTRTNRSSCRDVLAGGAILASRRVGSPTALPEKGINRSQQDFFILAGDGSPLGALGRHPGAEIHQIGEDFILGKVRDELGVEYVQLWGLDRRSVQTGRSQ